MCIHGFTDTWRTWELALPALERDHDVLAPTLAGHAGGPPLGGEVAHAAILCPSFYKADVVQNPNFVDRVADRVRGGFIRFMQRRQRIAA